MQTLKNCRHHFELQKKKHNKGGPKSKKIFYRTTEEKVEVQLTSKKDECDRCIFITNLKENNITQYKKIPEHLL